MNSGKHKLIEALAAMAYSIAKADGDIQNSEKRRFKNIIRQEFKEDSWVAEQRFELLDSAITPSLESAYQTALKEIKTYNDLFDQEMSSQFLRVIEKIADAFGGTDEEEEQLIEKMKVDFANLVKNGHNTI